MPIFRPTTALWAFTRNTIPLRLRQPITTRTLTTTFPHNAKAGYGDMEGNPMAKDPQNQGSSNSVKQKGEHPGPAPPAEGKGSGAGPTKGGAASPPSKSKTSTTTDSTSKSHYSTKTPSDASAQSGGSRSKEAKEVGSSPTGGKIEEGEKDPQSSKETQKKGKGSPRIMDEAEPQVETEEKKQEVKKHNKEFKKGHDHVPSEQGDKVEKKFWEGKGGADRQP